ncbi:hypothetical protein [Flavobacterium ammonificans]|uniref:Uncharacterized protein n=1 Tax=Flavobacterium ammonificans TaxID=1751056 RepID=A0ABM7V082_9FLAO|nr:hypothetical protein [Flavobacterium ammonificans]BDB53060.1 hypothetical protein GENT11_13720 [Flavobacterium ammonificans]
MATVQYTTYNFNTPPLISDSDFKILKDILTENPNYSINPSSSFIETFKVELIFLGIGLIGFYIASLDLADWLNWVGGIPAFLAFGSLFSFVPSMFSYLGYISDKSNYYRKLKKKIIKSENYNEFLNMRNK